MRASVFALGLGLGLGLGLAPGVAGQLVLLPPESLVDQPGFLTSLSVIAGDFDEDEHTDLVTYVSAFSFALAVYGGDGAGQFTRLGPPQSLTAGALGAAVDVNHDDHLDLILTDGTSGPGLAQVVLGAGDGTFGSPLAVSLPQFTDDTSVQVAVAHVDDDAHVDLILAVRLGGADQVAVLRGAGDGTFTGLQLLPALGFFSFVRNLDVVVDAQDGLDDLYVGVFSPAQGHVNIYAGEAGGGFASTPVVVPLLLGLVNDIAVGDVTGDGLVDLLACRAKTGELVVRRGLGGTRFAPAVVTAVGNEPNTLTLSDLDADGRLDVIVGRAVSEDLAAYLSLGDGTFAAPVFVSNIGVANASLGNTVCADVDEDGLPDLAVAQTGSESHVFVVVRNATYGPDEPFVDLGAGLAGTQGYPVLQLEGSLLPGSPFRLRSLNGLPGVAPVLVFGFSQLAGSLFGGTLWPAPDVLISMATANTNGTSSFVSTWPPHLAGMELWAQVWFADPLAPEGWSATSGVAIQSP